MKERIAYFGLGKMGIGPALNLQKAGFEVAQARKNWLRPAA